MTKVKYLKEYLNTLDEDAPIAYWLWQVDDVEAEIKRLKDCSDTNEEVEQALDIRGGNTEYEARLNKLTSDDITYILDSINEYFDDDVIYHAVSHALDKVTA